MKEVNKGYNFFKKIKELEEENRKLKEQLEILRGKLYERI
jgi:cell shape-determining protein MreC